MPSQFKVRNLGPGDILVENGTPLPPPLTLENNPGGSGWASLTNNLNHHQLSSQLATAGWTFFYRAGSIRTTAFGFDQQKSTNEALKRLIATVKLLHCNCLQIDNVATRSFWGMPYVSVSAHSLHIQRHG
jgi:hypothetical protein